METGAGKAKGPRPRSPRRPSEQLPEVFGAQFLRFLPGLEASGQSQTQVASEEDENEEEEKEEEGLASPAGSGGRSSLCSVPGTSVQSASSLFSGRAVGSPSLESGALPNRSLDSLADRWETRFLRRTTRAIITMRDTRILGVPTPYYALLLGSLTFCVASYTFASRSLHVVGAMTIGEAHVYTKKESGALLRAPAPVSSTHEDLTTSEEPPKTPRAAKRRHRGRNRAGTKKRHGKHRRYQGPHGPLRRSATATAPALTADAPWDATTWEAEAYWDLGEETVPTAEESTWGTTSATSTSTPQPPPSTVTTTRATSSSTPPTPPPTVAASRPARNKTFLNSSDLYDYEEVFEYYYVYDDNQTWKSKAPRAERRTIDSLQIN